MVAGEHGTARLTRLDGVLSHTVCASQARRRRKPYQKVR